jgi:hypothetical protein
VAALLHCRGCGGSDPAGNAAEMVGNPPGRAGRVLVRVQAAPYWPARYWPARYWPARYWPAPHWPVAR